MAEASTAEAPKADPPGFVRRTTRDGVPLLFPETMTNGQIDEVLRSQETANYTKNLPPLEPGGQDKPAGKVPPATPTGQTPPGVARDVGIGVGQFARGVASPVALPGDVYTAARQVSGDVLPPPPRYLPTSRDLDEIFTNQLGITPSWLEPQNRLERDIAAGARGAGEAVAPIAGARLVGQAARVATGTNALQGAGNIPLNVASGTASGVGTAEVADLQRREGTLPESSGGFAPLVAPAAGMAIGGAVGGGYSAGQSILQRVTGNTPFNRVLNGLGANVQTGEPFIATVGGDLQTMVRGTGQSASGLTALQYKAIAGPRVAPDAAYRAAISDPQTAMTLRQNFPDEMDRIAAGHLANNTSPSGWNSLLPRVRESLIPDQGDRSVLDQTFKGGTAPDWRDMASYRHLFSLFGLEGAREAANFFHADPSIAAGAAILGAAIPYAKDVGSWLYHNPAGRQAGIGAAVGVPPGTSVLPPEPMRYTAPGLTAPEDGAAEVVSP